MPKQPIVSIFQRLRPIAVFFLIGLLILGLSRLGLAWWHAAQVSAVNGWMPVFAQGCAWTSPACACCTEYPAY